MPRAARAAAAFGAVVGSMLPAPHAGQTFARVVILQRLYRMPGKMSISHRRISIRNDPRVWVFGAATVPHWSQYIGLAIGVGL